MEEKEAEGAGGTSQPAVVVSVEKHTFPRSVVLPLQRSFCPTACEAGVVSGISLPRTLPRQLLLCGRCIKREILIHLISGKLASCHPKVSAFSGEFVLLGGV